VIRVVGETVSGECVLVLVVQKFQIQLNHDNYTSGFVQPCRITVNIDLRINLSGRRDL
jgi:hypothetical protein